MVVDASREHLELNYVLDTNTAHSRLQPSFPDMISCMPTQHHVFTSASMEESLRTFKVHIKVGLNPKFIFSLCSCVCLANICRKDVLERR